MTPNRQPAALAGTGLLLLSMLGACSVGLTNHPLSDAQQSHFASRSAPERPEAVEDMRTIVVSVPVSADATKVWNQLALGYRDVHHWSGSIVDSGHIAGTAEQGKGCARFCVLGEDSPLGAGERFRETIVAWDADKMYYAAGVDDGFFPMKRVVQEFWVVKTPTGARVVSQFAFELRGAMASMMEDDVVDKLRRPLVTSLMGLKHLVESGNRKQAQDAKFLERTYPKVFESNAVDLSQPEG